MGAVIAFAVLAIFIIAGAAAFIVTDRLIYALLSCLLVFVGLAGMFLLLDAPFLAIAQILIYAGAIVTLVLFVVMLTVGNRPVENPTRHQLSAAMISVGLFVLLTLAIKESRWPLAKATMFKDTNFLATQIFGTYKLPFELAGVLLLAAVIGAVYLAKEELQ